jgi:hypothetical protein
MPSDDRLTMTAIRRRADARRRIEDQRFEPDESTGWPPPSREPAEALSIDPLPGETLEAYRARLEQRRKRRR